MGNRSRGFLLVFLGALLVAFLFRNPASRAFILWLLPLGRGIDDFIVIGALIFAAIYGLFYLFTHRRKG